MALFDSKLGFSSLNIGFTFERALTVFTHSTMTPPKLNRFRWNLEQSEYIVWGWPWQMLGTIRAEPGDFFCQGSNPRLYRFPVGQISRNLNTIRRPVCDKFFRNRILKIYTAGSFFQKNAKKNRNFQRLATSGHNNSATIRGRRKFITKITLYELSSFHFYRFYFTVEINYSKSFSWLYTLYKNLPPNFRRSRTPVERRHANNTDKSQWRTTIESSDHRPRRNRMQEVNS